MNKDEDILFLFLTSHGSEKFDLTVSFWPMDLNDLPASQLRKMLDDSGIKNRVIVVSSCFSGGFIDALKNDNTLIFTASRKDRVSFGCGVDEQFTYFGKAFFAEALVQHQEFVPAFEDAKKRVSAREKAEHITKPPSEPQMFEGKNIKLKLAQWYAAQK